MSHHCLVGGHCYKLGMTKTRKVKKLCFLCILLKRVFLFLTKSPSICLNSKEPLGTAAYYEVGKLVQTQKVRPGEIFGRGYCRTASEGLVLFDYDQAYTVYVETCIQLKTALFINATELGVVKESNNLKRRDLKTTPRVVLRQEQTSYELNGDLFSRIFDDDVVTFDDVGRFFTEGKVSI